MTLVLSGLPDKFPKAAGRFERRFIGLGAAAGEEEAVDVRIANRRQPLGQFDGRRIRAAGIGRGVGQPAHLLGGGIGQFGPAVADDDVPQAGQGIEKLAAAVVDQNRAAAGGPHMRLVGQRPIVERMDQMVAVALKFWIGHGSRQLVGETGRGIADQTDDTIKIVAEFVRIRIPTITRDARNSHEFRYMKALEC